MTSRTAIIHIGTPKTGTTSIQEVLSTNREQLIKAGLAYPKVPGKRAHASLGAYMGRAGGKSLRELDSYTGPTENLGAALQAELAELPASVQTVIFSAEHAWNQGFARDAVPALRELLEPMFSSFRIIVYLRRQDEKAVSLFSQALRRGAMPQSLLPQEPKSRLVFDFDAGLRPWVETFGRSSIDARIFERSAMRDGDVVSDFLVAAGAPDLKRPSVSENSSLRAEAQEFLLGLNRVPLRSAEPDSGAVAERSLPLGPRSPVYLRDFLAAAFPGRGLMPTRAEADAFYRSFEAANERVRVTFFPERRTLFNEDFSRYPHDPAPPPSAASVLSVALSVARMQATMIAELLAGQAVSRARKSMASGNRPAMIGGYIKALLRDPTSKPALDGLTEAVEAPDEVFRVRHFLAGSRIPKPMKEAAMRALDARFGKVRLVSPAIAARQAERRAKRAAAPRRDGAERRPEAARKRQDAVAEPATAKAKAKRRGAANRSDRGTLEQPTR